MIGGNEGAAVRRDDDVEGNRFAGRRRRRRAWALLLCGALAGGCGDDASSGDGDNGIPDDMAQAGSAAAEDPTPAEPMGEDPQDPGDPASEDPPAAVEFSDAERALYATLSPLPEAPPPDPTNAFADDPAAAELGQRLFFDPTYSGALKVESDLGAVGDAGKVACFSCHSGEYMDDDRSPGGVALGVDFHKRNAPPAVNSAFYRWTNWAGRFSAQWELPLAVAEAGVIMASSRLQIVHRIHDAYRDDYEAVFGAMDPAIADETRFPAKGKPKPPPTDEVPDPPDGDWESMSPEDQAIANRVFVNYGKALAAYLRTLVSRNAPFDAFVEGDEDALTESQKRGLALFIGKAHCVSCHAGPNFSDDGFHNLGLPQTGDHVPEIDEGRFGDSVGLMKSPFSSATEYSDAPHAGLLVGLTDPAPEETRGAFRTPTLRGVALTAPYMHAGQLATLGQVVDYYDQGGSDPVTGERDPLLEPLSLTDGEKLDLVHFLESLTGEPVADERLEDTSAP